MDVVSVSCLNTDCYSLGSVGKEQAGVGGWERGALEKAVHG